MSIRRSVVVSAGVVLAMLFAGCTDNSSSSENATSEDGGGSDPARITVDSSDDECTLSADTAPAGSIVFEVGNSGSQVTEFYVLEGDGVAIVSEAENIGPQLDRELVVRLAAGDYIVACKPGMTGDGIRSDFVVTESENGAEADPEQSELEATAQANYTDFVDGQAAFLLQQTTAFAELVKAGDDDAARALYAPARVPWESIEPVAESFGDLDPRLDLREADLEPGQEWTGWHRLEKDLWPPAEGYTPMTPAERTEVADLLVADTQELVDRIDGLEFDVAQMANGAKELLDEVATGKVTGEEEAWSHTDLWDFQANLDGAKVAFDAVRPIVVPKDPELVETLDTRFAEADAALDPYRVGDGFVLYTALTPDQVKALADTVNALAEPLSELTAAVVL